MGTIADGNVIEANDILSSMRTTAEAGEAIALGDACYIKESDGEAYISDKADLITLIDAQRLLLQFKLEYENAVVSYLQQKALLESYLGLEEGE